MNLIKKMKINMFYKNQLLCDKCITKTIKTLLKIAKYNPVTTVHDSIERMHIEDFIQENSQYINGKVLEFKGTENYAHKYINEENITYCAGLPSKKSYEHFTDIKFFFDYEDISTFPDKKFDCIIFTQCLVYTFNPVLVLSNLGKLLKPNGVILISSNMYAQNNPNAPFVNFITSYGLKECLTKLKDKYTILSLQTYGNIYSVIYNLFNIKRVRKWVKKENSPFYPVLLTAVIQKKEENNEEP